MITPFNSIYLSPNKAFRQLSLLFAIHEKPNASQHAIGRITHLSSSMVNNYIKQFEKEELLDVAGVTNRTRSYHLTEKGRGLLREALLSYSAEIVQMYGAVKGEIANILKSFYEEGIRTVALFGAAETAEVVYAALKETDLVVIGVLDSDPLKHGEPFNGFFVKPPELIIKMNPDAVIITSFAKQEEIYASIEKIVGTGIKVKKLSDIAERVDGP